MQTSLITKELIKHENKLIKQRKFWKSIFRIFIFHERVQKVYHEHFSVVYTMKLSWNTYFMKCSEGNISQCFLAFRNFAKFTGKHLCQSFFLKQNWGLSPATLLKKRLWHRCFQVNFSKFLRTPVLQNTSRRLLLLETG